MTKTSAKKYLSAIKGSKIRHLTCEALSRSMGIYPDVIASDLSFFEPMLAMDLTFDLRDIIPSLESYIEEQEQAKPKEHQLHSNSLELRGYESVGDFVYKKMTINGIVSKNVKLSEDDLKILAKLVDMELKPAKKSKKRK
ncbi:MAG: hypothetical protein MJ222_02465 [Bacilli bacterium]|nr:hypothetical protein [Bacilli bacterium]